MNFYIFIAYLAFWFDCLSATINFQTDIFLDNI